MLYQDEEQGCLLIRVADRLGQLLSGGFFAFFFISLYRKPTLGNVAIFIYFLPRPKQFRRAGRLTSFLKRSIGHVISLFFSILKRALSTDCTRLNSSANSHIRFWGSFLGGCFHPFPNVIWAKILHLRKTGSGFLLQPSPAPLKTPPIKYRLPCAFGIHFAQKLHICVKIAFLSESIKCFTKRRLKFEFPPNDGIKSPHSKAIPMKEEFV